LRAGRQAVSTWAEDLGRVMETHVASGIELNVLCQLLESDEVSVASHEYKTLLSDQVLASPDQSVGPFASVPKALPTITSPVSCFPFERRLL